MKNLNLASLLLILLMTPLLSGCDLAGDIFEAGAWTAIIGIVLVIALIVWLFRKFMD